jgi:hypothetical protein
MTSLVSSDSVARSEGTPSVKARQQAMSSRAERRA